MAHDSPGQVIPLYLDEKQYRLNDGAFLVLDGTAYYTMETQSIGKALFGGQGGFFVMTTQGQGRLFWPMLTVLLKNCAKQSRSDY
ncbi:HTH DNA-binding protein [Streptococcus thermophilus]|nr:HTH DNA-binding protein [Streptococcus thermophilus]